MEIKIFFVQKYLTLTAQIFPDIINWLMIPQKNKK